MATKSNKEKVLDIKSKAKKCVDDKKGVNAVIDILCYSQVHEISCSESHEHVQSITA